MNLTDIEEMRASLLLSAKRLLPEFDIELEPYKGGLELARINFSKDLFNVSFSISVREIAEMRRFLNRPPKSPVTDEDLSTVLEQNYKQLILDYYRLSRNKK